MQQIVIIGAGRSATALIQYTLKQAEKYGWFVTVADADPKMAEAKVNNHPRGRATWLDVTKPNDRRDLIQRADIVVSLMPVMYHNLIAHDCLQLKKHLVTASYISKEINNMRDTVAAANLTFFGEMGLDPGIDHMSAMQIIERIKAQNGKLTAFSSYTGGLVAPESDNNPWHYKISWNPRNVVLAGQGTAQYLANNRLKYIPYHRLFRQYKLVNIPDVGEYEAYANRDSLMYREIYNLPDIPNILRATLRHKGFCDAWAALVRIGLTDDSYPISNSDQITYLELLDAYLSDGNKRTSVRDRVARLLRIASDSPVMEKLEWLGLFSQRRIKLPNASPAQILQQLLEEKLVLQPHDKDMVIMHHEFEYEINGKKKRLTSSMTMKGENSIDTAMARLVGLPLGIFVKLLMLGKVNLYGVHIPVMKSVYDPVLLELEEYGVKFVEYEHEL